MKKGGKKMDKVLMILRKDAMYKNTSFSSSKFLVEEIYDVIEALKKIKEEKPKFIVIDMATSRICGMDLIRIIRCNPANYHIKIIVTAKNFNYRFMQEIFDLGADFFIKYPIEIKDIENIYQNLKVLENYVNLEMIAKNNDFQWISEI